MRSLSITLLICLALLIGLPGRLSAGEAQNALDEGVKLYRSGKYKQAVTAYDRAIKAAPNAAEAYAGRGSAYAKLGHDQSIWVAVMEKAFTHFRTGVADFDEIAGGWMSEVYKFMNLNWEESYNYYVQSMTGQQILTVIEELVAAGKSVTRSPSAPASAAAATNDAGRPRNCINGFT